MRHKHRREGRERKRERMRRACLLTLAVGGARGQGCQDDPTGLIASYGLDCATISQAYPCTWDMQAAGWLVPPHTTVTDECPSFCDGCTDTSGDAGADDLQDNLPSEQTFLNIAYGAPVVGDSHTGSAVVSRVTDGFAGPNNEWVSGRGGKGGDAPHWVM